MPVAKIIVNFDSEQQAVQFIDRLTQQNLGEARARVLSSSEDMSYGNDESSAPMIIPEMGSVEVRPSETPSMPQREHEDVDEQVSANIPVTGAEGVQVMIEVEDAHEELVRHLLREFSQGCTR